ncbi:MAG: universal stress protein [Planctomycetes bacterium]|nr:universal stress protein [Planctomycetota bacterium]
MKTELILCPVDFSVCSEMAVELASRLAVPNHSRVLLLHVSDPSKEDSHSTTLAEAFSNNARTKLRDQTLEERKIAVEHLNMKGDPAELIVQVAHAKKVDTIVMGTHGRSGWSKWMIGSVAQAVMKSASCPVITVRPPAEDV